MSNSYLNVLLYYFHTFFNRIKTTFVLLLLNHPMYVYILCNLLAYIKIIYA